MKEIGVVVLSSVYKKVLADLVLTFLACIVKLWYKSLLKLFLHVTQKSKQWMILLSYLSLLFCYLKEK